MSKFTKIAGINLLVLVVYSIWIRIANGGGDRGGGALGIMTLSALAVGIHVVVCLLAAGIESGTSKGKGAAKAWLWSALIVLLVGFSVCWGNASI